MYSQALRFNAGLKRAIFAVILSFLCIFLLASKSFNSLAFADTATDTIDGTMSIVLDTTQDPDTPIPSPDPDDPNPNPGDSSDGNNGDNSSAGESSGDGNQDALKANSINKNGSNKDSLASTGDVVTTTLIVVLALATVLTAFVYVSRRRLAVNSGISYSQSSNKAKSAALVLLTLTLLSGTIFTAFKAFAEGEDADILTNSTATLNSKVVVDENGKIKSTDLTLKNNLKTTVTVKSVSAPAEVSAWTANVDADTVVAAGDTLTKDWTPDAEAIPAELLSKLNNGEEVNLTFSTEVSYTVFNITWNLNGGQGIIATSPVPENGNVVLPATNPTFDHYTFEGWNTRNDGQGDAVDENTVVTADVTFYAKWTPETYAINYRFPDGGEFAGGVEPEKTYTYGVGLDSFEEPYKQGYDFDGWEDAATGRKVTSISTTDFGDKTLWARWTPGTTTYKVEYWLQNIDDDGYSVSASDTLTLNGTTGTQTQAPHKSFTGFEGSNVGQTTIKADGSTVLKYYYSRIKYDVTFNLNGKAGTPPTTQKVKYQGKVTKPATDPTATGYTFTDWYATASGAGVAFNFDSTQITSATTLYARWTPISYTVKFDKNDTSATGTMEDQTFTYDTAQSLSTNAFIKANSTFTGWAETPTGEVKYTDAQEVKNLATAQGSVVTLYAKWDDTPTYTVTFDVTGGGDTGAPSGFFFTIGDEGAGLSKAVVDVKSGQAMPDVTSIGEVNRIPFVGGDNVQGYVFDGWYTQPNGGGEEGIIGTTKITGNVTYYPKWVVATTFIAPTTSTVTANARTIPGIKYGLNYIKAAAEDLKAKEKAGDIARSQFYRVINDWMTNDSYHLYTLLKSGSAYKDPSNTDSWAEFRIIQVGQHDNDESGLTFQMVHGLPTRYQYDTNGNSGANLNWLNSTLRYNCQAGGAIYQILDTNLTNSFKSIEKKYNTTAGAKPSESTIASTTDKLWILSYTEYQSNVNTTYWTKDQLGSTYTYWKSKAIVNDSETCPSNPPLLNLTKTRSGTLLKESSWSFGHTSLRSVSPNSSNGVMAILNNTINSKTDSDSNTKADKNGIALAFAV